MIHPIEQIIKDRQVARSHDDSNADTCVLALADGGVPSVRTLVLREIDETGFTLFINQTSNKWRIIEKNPSAELLIWYHATQRQFRIGGTVQLLDASIIQGNWMRRPAGSKYLDHAYEQLGPQSSPIDSRDTLVRFISDLKSRTPEEQLSTPPSAVGVRVVPEWIECLDLNNQDRIHDRKRYQRSGSGWEVQQLIP